MAAKNKDIPAHHRPRNAPAGPPTKRVLYVSGTGKRRMVDADQV